MMGKRGLFGADGNGNDDFQKSMSKNRWASRQQCEAQKPTCLFYYQVGEGVVGRSHTAAVPALGGRVHVSPSVSLPLPHEAVCLRGKRELLVTPFHQCRPPPGLRVTIAWYWNPPQVQLPIEWYTVHARIATMPIVCSPPSRPSHIADD